MRKFSKLLQKWRQFFQAHHEKFFAFFMWWKYVTAGFFQVLTKPQSMPNLSCSSAHVLPLQVDMSHRSFSYTDWAQLFFPLQSQTQYFWGVWCLIFPGQKLFSNQLLPFTEAKLWSMKSMNKNDIGVKVAKKLSALHSCTKNENWQPQFRRNIETLKSGAAKCSEDESSVLYDQKYINDFWEKSPQFGQKATLKVRKAAGNCNLAKFGPPSLSCE